MPQATTTRALLAAALSIIAIHGATAQPVSSAPPAPAAAQARFSVDTPIETLAANPAAAAVIEKHAPGLLHHEHYPMFKSMSLREIAPMTGGTLDDAALAAMNAELAAIG